MPQSAAEGAAQRPAAPQPTAAATGMAGAAGAASPHALAVQAFEQRQVAAWAQSDVTSSLLLALLFALARSTARWRTAGWAAAVAGAVQLALLLAPGLLSALQPRHRYLPRRHWIVAACRLLNLGLYQLSTPLQPLLPRQWGDSWMATLKLLACIRLPSLSMMAWAYRMPLPVSKQYSRGACMAAPHYPGCTMACSHDHAALSEAQAAFNCALQAVPMVPASSPLPRLRAALRLRPPACDSGGGARRVWHHLPCRLRRAGAGAAVPAG